MLTELQNLGSIETLNVHSINYNNNIKMLIEFLRELQEKQAPSVISSDLIDE